MSLTEFLLARIAEDEAVLTRTEAFQHASHGYDAPGTYSPTCPTCRQFVWGTKRRALAECEAKRRLITFADEVVGAMDMQIQGEWGSGPILPEHDEELRMLRLLAIPYADHPDYRSEWAP